MNSLLGLREFGLAESGGGDRDVPTAAINLGFYIVQKRNRNMKKIKEKEGIRGPQAKDMINLLLRSPDIKSHLKKHELKCLHNHSSYIIDYHYPDPYLSNVGPPEPPGSYVFVPGSYVGSWGLPQKIDTYWREEKGKKEKREKGGKKKREERRREREKESANQSINLKKIHQIINLGDNNLRDMTNVEIAVKVRTFPSAKAFMQLPRASNDLLMLAPSRIRSPQFLVAVALSDPAKSTKTILEIKTSLLKPAFRGLCFKCTSKMEIIKTYDTMIHTDKYGCFNPE
uniref:Uncharacterized protein n=1 Tax=Romanomermis culicivorax TaxID=13658 RepID=A0A915HMT9_ROMCU